MSHRVLDPPPPTTADIAVSRFYRKVGRAYTNHSRPSFVEAITRAPSPFAIETILRDFEMFAASGATEKTKRQVGDAAHARLCELRGVLP